jgi:hypothetical protein
MESEVQDAHVSCPRIAVHMMQEMTCPAHITDLVNIAGNVQNGHGMDAAERLAPYSRPAPATSKAALVHHDKPWPRTGLGGGDSADPGRPLSRRWDSTYSSAGSPESHYSQPIHVNRPQSPRQAGPHVEWQ